MLYTNYMEELVEHMLDNIIYTYKKEKICCEKCRQDVISISLNNLPPMYYSTKETYHKIKSLDPQLQARITTEIIKALDIVKKNPRHTLP